MITRLFHLGGLAFCVALTSAAGLTITPNFDTTVSGNANAANIESAINSAIDTIDGLYGNPVNITVTFTYNSAAPGNLLSTEQYLYDESYNSYKDLLMADSVANPGNTVLATALSNLSKGSDSNGSQDLAITGAQATMLGITGLPDSPADNAVININSTQDFAFSRPVDSSAYDLIGGLEHELDEVLGGGGAGSTLNSLAGCGSGFFCGKFGALDLYRYSAANTPSYTNSGSATSYFSVDGGATSIVSFNQDSNGDFADFAPPGAGAGQLIQDAFNSTGQDEAYTSSSPEFAMLQSIGWDSAVPEPGTIGLLGCGLAFLALYRRRKA